MAGTFLSGVSAAAFLNPAAVVTTDDTEPAAKMEPWKAEVEIFERYASQLRFFIGRKIVVWVKSIADKEKDARVSHLFLSTLTENDTRPDGEGMAFVQFAASHRGTGILA